MLSLAYTNVEVPAHQEVFRIPYGVKTGKEEEKAMELFLNREIYNAVAIQYDWDKPTGSIGMKKYNLPKEWLETKLVRQVESVGIATSYILDKVGLISSSVPLSMIPSQLVCNEQDLFLSAHWIEQEFTDSVDVDIANLVPIVRNLVPFSSGKLELQYWLRLIITNKSKVPRDSSGFNFPKVSTHEIKLPFEQEIWINEGQFINNHQSATDNSYLNDMKVVLNLNCFASKSSQSVSFLTNMENENANKSHPVRRVGTFLHLTNHFNTEKNIDNIESCAALIVREAVPNVLDQFYIRLANDRKHSISEMDMILSPSLALEKAPSLQSNPIGKSYSNKNVKDILSNANRWIFAVGPCLLYKGAQLPIFHHCNPILGKLLDTSTSFRHISVKKQSNSNISQGNVSYVPFLDNKIQEFQDKVQCIHLLVDSKILRYSVSKLSNCTVDTNIETEKHFTLKKLLKVDLLSNLLESSISKDTVQSIRYFVVESENILNSSNEEEVIAVGNFINEPLVNSIEEEAEESQSASFQSMAPVVSPMCQAKLISDQLKTNCGESDEDSYTSTVASKRRKVSDNEETKGFAIEVPCSKPILQSNLQSLNVKNMVDSYLFLHSDEADQNTKLINQPLDVISAAKSSAVNSERQSFAPFSEFEYDQQKQPAKENNFSVDKLNSFFVKRSERATFSSALRQYKALAHDDNTIKRTLKDLQMLVSEDILETHQSLIASLSSSYSVECMDCPLNYPETIIIGLTNCISIVKWEHLQEDELAIKDFMKKLTSIAFKYSNITILLLIESIEDEIDQRMLLGILQYLAKFPMTVSVRYWCENSDTLSNTVALLIKETVTLMKIGGRDSKDCSNTISSVKTQPYLHLLSDKVFSAHTEFLQLFPTINFSSAAMLLSQYTLHDLVEIVLVHFTENNSFEFASFLLQSMQFEHVYQFDLLVAQIVKLLQALVAHVGLAIIEM